MNLKEKYTTEIVPALVAKHGYKNVTMAPKLEKIVVNVGVGTQKERDALPEAQKTLTAITGQHAVITVARRSLASFKIRDGQKIGTKVTLRGEKMYDFLTRLIHNALPRVRDFRGIKTTGFDGFGNYTMGLTDQSVFTEVDLDRIKYTHGMNISFVTTAKSDEEGRSLLDELGLPFAK